MNANDDVFTDAELRVDGADICPVCMAELLQNNSSCPACGAPVALTAAIAPLECMLSMGTAFKRSGSLPSRVRLPLIGIFLLIACFGGWAVFESVRWLWECSQSGTPTTIGNVLSALFAACFGFALIVGGCYGAFKHWSMRKVQQ